MKKDYSEFGPGWKVVLASAVGVGSGVTGVAFYTAGLFLKPLTVEFHWSRAAVSAATLCLHFGWAAMAPVIGRLSDRFDVRRIVLVSMIGVILGFLALTQVSANIWTFYLGLVFLGMAGSGTAPVAWARAVSSWFDKARGLALGLTLAGTGVAGIVAPKAVDGLIQQHGWRGGYLGLAIFVAVVALPIVFVFFHERKVIPTVAASKSILLTGATPGEAVRSIRFWQLAIGILLIGGAMAAMLVHLVPLLTDDGLSRGDATSVASAVGIAVVVSRIITGFLVDRFHGPYVAGVVLSVPALGYLVIAAHPGPGWELILAAMTIGIAAGAEIDLLAFLTTRFFGLRRFGGVYGLLLVAFAIGSGTSPILMGRVYDVMHSYDYGLYAGAAACVLGALLFGTMGRYPKAFAPPDQFPQIAA